MEATKEKAAHVAKELTHGVNVVLLAMTHAQLERERVDVIERNVLSEQIYHGHHRTRNDQGRTGSNQFRVIEPRDSWLMDDQSAGAYHARLDGIHVAAGFEKAKDGYCPALRAESLETEAENALIAEAEQFFPGVTNNGLICDPRGKGMERRKKYLDLIIGLVVNAPGYRKVGI